MRRAIRVRGGGWREGCACARCGVGCLPRTHCKCLRDGDAQVAPRRSHCHRTGRYSGVSRYGADGGASKPGPRAPACRARGAIPAHGDVDLPHPTTTARLALRLLPTRFPRLPPGSGRWEKCPSHGDILGKQGAPLLTARQQNPMVRGAMRLPRRPLPSHRERRFMAPSARATRFREDSRRARSSSVVRPWSNARPTGQEDKTAG